MMLSSTPPSRCSETGASLVSFSYTLPVFMLIVMGILEFTMAAFLQHSLLNAVQRSARYAALGLHLVEAGGDADLAVDSVRAKVSQLAGRDINAAAFKMCLNGETDCAANNPGQGGDWVYIEASYPSNFVLSRYFGDIKAATFIRLENTFNASDIPDEEVEELSKIIVDKGGTQPPREIILY